MLDGIGASWRRFFNDIPRILKNQKNKNKYTFKEKQQQQQQQHHHHHYHAQCASNYHGSLEPSTVHVATPWAPQTNRCYEGHGQH
ncbi:hypothetical protein V9T40_004487 [Parthenolecanium corni]|uniref:Uncharacterized protein n=1 Tax=Parthenolecanium corni TaxID=536013 RepID=A0AAN9U1Z6_9HEMI